MSGDNVGDRTSLQYDWRNAGCGDNRGDNCSAGGGFGDGEHDYGGGDGSGFGDGERYGLGDGCGLCLSPGPERITEVAQLTEVSG